VSLYDKGRKSLQSSIERQSLSHDHHNNNNNDNINNKKDNQTINLIDKVRLCIQMQLPSSINIKSTVAF
jgi:hypothetical protein